MRQVSLNTHISLFIGELQICGERQPSDAGTREMYTGLQRPGPDQIVMG